MTYDKSLPDEHQISPVELTKETTLDLRKVSSLFLVLAIITGIVGLCKSRDDAGVVGGDAYNFIIGAGRGTAIVCVAIIFALVSVVLALFELTNLLTNDIKKRDQK